MPYFTINIYEDRLSKFVTLCFKQKKDSLEKRKQCEHGTSATKEPRAKLTIYR